MDKKIFKYTIAIISIILSASLISSIYFRNLPEKPIIDVVITSLSSIFAACIAAAVAYYAAKIQIDNARTTIEEERLRKLKSTIKLLYHEIDYNKSVLQHATQMLGDDAVIGQFVSIRLNTNIWNQISLMLVEDLEEDIFEAVTSYYYNLFILTQEFGYTKQLLTICFSDSVAIHTTLKTYIDQLK